MQSQQKNEGGVWVRRGLVDGRDDLYLVEYNGDVAKAAVNTQGPCLGQGGEGRGFMMQHTFKLLQSDVCFCAHEKLHVPAPSYKHTLLQLNTCTGGKSCSSWHKTEAVGTSIHCSGHLTTSTHPALYTSYSSATQTESAVYKPDMHCEYKYHTQTCPRDERGRIICDK